MIFMTERRVVRRRSRSRRETFLEPVVRVRLRVERGDLNVSRRPVERDGLRERAVRLELDDARARAPRILLQLGEEPPPDAKAPRLARDPHPLEICRLAARRLHRAGAD